MPNDTACSSTGFSMARHVASHPADNCAFDASLRLDSVRKCEAQQGGTNDQTFHDGLLRGYVRVNPSRQRFVPNKALRSRNILSLVIEILRRRPNVFWTFAAPRIKYASYRFSFITAIIATKIFLASPAVIAALSGLKPALWANAPASIICSVGFDSFSIILS